MMQQGRLCEQKDAVVWRDGEGFYVDPERLARRIIEIIIADFQSQNAARAAVRRVGSLDGALAGQPGLAPA